MVSQEPARESESTAGWFLGCQSLILRSSTRVRNNFQTKRKKIANDRKVIPDPIDDRKFHE